jgi:adenine-specific DNA-methyltransferase
MNKVLNRVTCGDCCSIMPELPDSSVDFVLTDPPYVVGYHDRAGRSVANDDSTDWLKPAFDQIYRVLTADSFCVSFYGWTQVDKFLAAWRSAGFTAVGHLVFIKRYASNDRSERGFLRYHHEMAYLLAKGRPDMPRALLSDVIQWQYTGNTRHPTEKPVSCLLPLVYAFTGAGDIVLDPFCGSGSTLVAAKLLGRQYIGIEVSAAHARTAQARL